MTVTKFNTRAARTTAAKSSEEGYYVVSGRPGEWEYVSGPFATKDKADADKSRLNLDGPADYTVKKLLKKPKAVEASPSKIRAALSENVSRALVAIKSVSVSDRTMDVRRLYPTYKEAIAVTIDEPSATEPTTSRRLKSALVKAGFTVETLKSTVMEMGTSAPALDVSAISEDGYVEVVFSALNGLAIVLESVETM